MFKATNWRDYEASLRQRGSLTVWVTEDGHGPERQVQTGIGPVTVQRARLRDRGASEAAERIRFTSAILPRWARRTRSLDALLPILHLRGVSMGDLQETRAGNGGGSQGGISALNSVGRWRKLGS